ncbi:MAG: hypothetical protein AAF383_11800, partial [Cyanobacteria bacterium P01_A01_bin.83]
SCKKSNVVGICSLLYFGKNKEQSINGYYGKERKAPVINLRGYKRATDTLICRAKFCNYINLYYTDLVKIL